MPGIQNACDATRYSWLAWIKGENIAAISARKRLKIAFIIWLGIFAFYQIQAKTP